MNANPSEDFRDQFLVVAHVCDHRQARLDLVEHVTDRVMRAVSLVDRRHADNGRHAEFQRRDVHGVGLDLGHEDIHALG
jgi:hypothetical protein